MLTIDALLQRFLLRMPFGSKLASVQTRAASFAEQGLQGAANVLVNVILARNLPQQGFATIGIMLGVHWFVLGMHRTAVVLPFVLDASRTDNDGVQTEQRWWWLNLLSVGVVAIGLALTTLIAFSVATSPGDAWFRNGIALTVLVTPALLLFEFGRRILYQRGLPATAALASFVYLLINLFSAILLMRYSATAESGAIAWIVAGLGAALVTILAVPPGAPRFAEGIRIWWSNREFAFWQALTNLPYAVYNSSVGVVVGIFGGATAVAAFTAARTLTNPALSMVTAVDSLDKPRAARALAADGLPGLQRSIGHTRRLLVLITGIYLGLIIVFAGPILQLAFGNIYSDQVNEICVLAMAFFVICMNQPSETFLIVLRASKLLLATRIVAAVFAVVSLAVGSSHGLMGSCIALLATHVVNLANLRIVEGFAAKRWLRERFASASAPAAPDDSKVKVSQWRG